MRRFLVASNTASLVSDQILGEIVFVSELPFPSRRAFSLLETRLVKQAPAADLPAKQDALVNGRSLAT